MPWTYHQRTGLVTRGSVTIRGGYAGHGAGYNNPAMQHVRGIGPLPRGSYTIGLPRDSRHVARYAMPLTPAPRMQMFGRSAFYIHGDSSAHPGEASDGCIVFGLHARQSIWASGDHQLDVVE